MNKVVAVQNSHGDVKVYQRVEVAPDTIGYQRLECTLFKEEARGGLYPLVRLTFFISLGWLIGWIV